MNTACAIGYGTFGYKLAASLAGGLAGLAGYPLAAQTGFVNPELMVSESAHAIMMIILGGMGNLRGDRGRLWPNTCFMCSSDPRTVGNGSASTGSVDGAVHRGHRDP